MHAVHVDNAQRGLTAAVVQRAESALPLVASPCRPGPSLQAGGLRMNRHWDPLDAVLWAAVATSVCFCLFALWGIE